MIVLDIVFAVVLGIGIVNKVDLKVILKDVLIVVLDIVLVSRVFQRW